MEDLVIVAPIPEEYYSKVIEHLRDSFFPDEPLNHSVGLCVRGQPHEELEKDSYATLRDQISTIAFDPRTNQVAAVCLNGIFREEDIDKAITKLETVPDVKYKTIFSHIYDINKSLNLFEKYQVESMFELRILSVDCSFRNRGLAYKLVEKSEELAIKKGFKVLKADSTGVYSQRIFTKFGFETIYERMYDTIRHPNGDIVFKTNAPHKSLKIMIKVIE